MKGKKQKGGGGVGIANTNRLMLACLVLSACIVVFVSVKDRFGSMNNKSVGSFGGAAELFKIGGSETPPDDVTNVPPSEGVVIPPSELEAPQEPDLTQIDLTDQITREYDLDEDPQFLSVEEFRSGKDGRCPSLRHCPYATRKNFFYGSGSWDDDMTIFSPHKCWNYQHLGNEPWLNVHKGVIVLLDGDKGRSPYSKAASDSQLFRHVDMTVTGEESDLVLALNNVLSGEIIDADKFNLTVVLNWVPENGGEAEFIDFLHRVGDKVEKSNDKIRGVHFIWTAIPYYDSAQVDDAIVGNEKMNNAIESAYRGNAETVNVRGLDLFAPSLSLKGDKTGSSPEISKYLTNAIYNIVFSGYIRIHSGASVEDHVCKRRSGACSNCFNDCGRVDSDRLTFNTFAIYFYRRSVPTIISLKDEHKTWYADGDWLRLVKENGDIAMTVRRNYASTKTRRFSKMPLTKFLQEAKIIKKETGNTFSIIDRPYNKGEKLPVYAGNNKLTQTRMSLFHLKYPKWISKPSFQRPAMWVGPKGSMSSLHQDHSNRGNLAYQILGAKKWHLTPPTALPLMYSKGHVVIWSLVQDPEIYDKERAAKLPLFKYAIPQSMVCIVQEGEMLFNPLKWWHAVYNIESSLMLNYWIRNKVPTKPSNKL